ncbi:MAG: hypothetical protein KDI82_02800 [Gammaproteobacteria bacterium]|nr:hypothetical protein [Gammaproteobacteria bacterium]
MRRASIAVLSVCLVLASGHVLAEKPEHGKHGEGKHPSGMAMHHANPMPNLMKVIKKHGDDLNLSGEQYSALVQWRKAHMDPMHALADKVVEMENALNQAAIAGRPKAELMVMNSRILAAREQIVATKIDCRDNLRRVLSPEQYSKVLAIYADMQAGS